MKKSIKRIGVLTGGGDCPGLNAVIRAVVKTAIRRYDLEVVGISDGFYGLVNDIMKPLTEDDVAGIVHRGGTILGTTNRDNPFRYAVEKDGQLVFEDRSEQCMAIMERRGIDALIMIGGDGSLNIAYNFHKKGVPVVGVPKTIDNDLSATDVTFGFDSAITTATSALDKLHTTAESHHRIMILEVMGRYAGWIALHSGVAGGADVILIPEIPYDMDQVANHIRARAQKGRKFSIVVVAEGAKEIGGEMVVQKMVAQSHDPIRLGGIGNAVGAKLEEMTGMETRVTVLGHVQRGGSPTVYDRVLSTRYGVAAVDAIMSGHYGHMVALRTPFILPVPLTEAIGTSKKVDPEDQLVRTAKAVGISFGN
ncbi:6-phosphofructokinase [Heliophilum fasciatum]|uniref:ATP-dependent 6-phosphofructokinase n=1 Tax=Heliophilum fasciatum TaxID=35700 RepID=A0A4R2RYE0_9FIRM|nr:6-phosphofructokinase [Heliophilum fasciatum]MCW2276927.1 6-phosphofructokinase 1 [Heliophilum fasciatum]TCP68613.1 6-phosphofructokinase [Heliophilum fasciatum]